MCTALKLLNKKEARKTKQNKSKKNFIKYIYKQSKNMYLIQSERKRKQGYYRVIASDTLVTNVCVDW